MFERGVEERDVTRSGDSAEVIVVGGGPAGATTAWGLARLGADVLVVERARFPRPKPCAEYLSPQASRVLADMGALEPIEQAGAAHLAGMTVRAPNGVTFEGRFAAAHGFRGFRDQGLAIRRAVLDAIVLDRARAAGARVAERTQVTGVVRDASGRACGVRVRGDDGRDRDLLARLVVGADGLHSVVARRLGLARTSRWPRRIAFVAHYRDVAGMGDCGEMLVGHAGYCGLADVGGGITNVAIVVPRSRAAGARGDAASFFQRTLASQPGLAARFARATRVSQVQVTGPFAAHARRAWAAGAALVGDAADFFDPFTGEGIYAALRGGELLAPHLHAALRAGSSRASDAALAAYDRARRSEFAGKWRVERLVALAVSSPFLLNQVARALARHTHLADLLVGVAGDFVPARELLRPGFLLPLLVPVRTR